MDVISVRKLVLVENSHTKKSSNTSLIKDVNFWMQHTNEVCCLLITDVLAGMSPRWILATLEKAEDVKSAKQRNLLNTIERQKMTSPSSAMITTVNSYDLG